MIFLRRNMYFCICISFIHIDMKRFLLSLFALCTLAMGCFAQQQIYDFQVADRNGQPVSLSAYQGKVLLIINSATACGFTPQYTELQALYDRMHNLGFEILDFPCNQFGAQAPGTAEEIHQVCTARFNITFPQFDKVEVNGSEASPLFSFLKSKQGFKGFDLNSAMGQRLDQKMRSSDPNYDKNPDIKWNFTKFLVDRRGFVIARYEPTHPLYSIEEDIMLMLQ